jgi:hypothetical protein
VAGENITTAIAVAIATSAMSGWRGRMDEPLEKNVPLHELPGS